MVVDVQEGSPQFHAAAPRSLFRSDAATGLIYPRYDVAPDDDGFLMVEQGVDALPRLVRVQNFLTDLKRGTSQ